MNDPDGDLQAVNVQPIRFLFRKAVANARIWATSERQFNVKGATIRAAVGPSRGSTITAADRTTVGTAHCAPGVAANTPSHGSTDRTTHRPTNFTSHIATGTGTAAVIVAGIAGHLTGKANVNDHVARGRIVAGVAGFASKRILADVILVRRVREFATVAIGRDAAVRRIAEVPGAETHRVVGVVHQHAVVASVQCHVLGGDERVGMVD